MTPMTRILVFSITCMIAMAGVNGIGRRTSIVSLMWFVWVSGFAGLICYSILKFIRSSLNQCVGCGVRLGDSFMCVVEKRLRVMDYEIAHYAFGITVCLILGSVDLWVRRVKSEMFDFLGGNRGAESLRSRSCGTSVQARKWG